MINRVLIRMKVVQLLYSYLLVEKPFTLESQPSAPTKEKRFAYNLYFDLIYLIDHLSAQVHGKNNTLPLAETRFVLKTSNDDKIKALRAAYSQKPFPFLKVEAELGEEIRQSLLFKEFEKNLSVGDSTDKFWENILGAIILPNKEVNEIIQSLPDFSLSAVEKTKLLLAETFKNFYASGGNVNDALNTLNLSLKKARDLYISLLALPVEVTALRLKKLEQNRKKFLATEEDINPNMKLVNNRIPVLIENNPDFQEYINTNHISWMNEDPELLEILLNKILDSDVYKKYSEEKESDIKKDAEFWRDILIEVVLNDQDFLEFLENKSVFWNDDLEIMGSFVLKSLKRLENSDTASAAVLPMYKDGDKGSDAKFGAQLISYVIKNKDLYHQYIEEVLSKDKWEAERLAFMDIVIVMTALAEIINYPDIPLAVTVNEYIEIAKSYSSAKSGQFINGLLASLIDKLQADGIIYKR